MGSKYQAEQRVEHVAIACAPDLIRPTPKDPPLPFITYAEFDTAVNVAVTAAANQHPAFVSVSGDVSLDHALHTLARQRPEARPLVAPLLARLKGP